MNRFYTIVVCSIFFVFPSLIAAKESYFFVLLNPNPNRVKLDSTTSAKLQNEHMSNIDRLAKAGSLLAAGPFEGGGGMFIFNAHSEKEVLDSLQTDAAVKADRFLPEVFEMNILRGSICPVKGKYTMRMCTALRLKFATSGPRGLDDKKMDSEIETWITETSRNGKVIFACSFGRVFPSGAMIIAEIPEEKKEAVRSFEVDQPRWFAVDLKKLYIAKGTFCETE